MAKRILVIEDEAAIRDLICMNLEVAGYETVVFGDGIEVSEALKKEHKYDCALLDIMLPGKDGFALLPELSGYQIPVIFLTAKGDIQSKIKGLTEGAEDYLVKPFEMLELLVRLEKVMARQGKQEDCIRIRNVEIYPEAAKMKKQMTYADKKEIPFVALIGENEMQEGIISLKNMLSGEQHNVTTEELVERLKR